MLIYLTGAIIDPKFFLKIGAQWYTLFPQLNTVIGFALEVVGLGFAIWIHSDHIPYLHRLPISVSAPDIYTLLIMFVSSFSWISHINLLRHHVASPAILKL